VHVGRLIELDVEDASQVPEMCERLLANPLIEDYEVVEIDNPPVRAEPAPSGTAERAA
jgi:phosphoribosylformylglycinamidine (FGAM) synthase PurS component